MARKHAEKVVFTDLDGTLLDHGSYSWKAAEPALRKARELGVPIVLCTSKTRAEVEFCRKRLGNREPFIAENGEAVYIPEGYFRERLPGARKKGRYLVIELGKPYKEVRTLIKRMQARGMKVKGFGDMPVKELSELTGLSAEQAKLAKKREYDEPFLLENPKQEEKVLSFIKKSGFQCTRGGRFYHIMAGSGKGYAAKLLTIRYSKEAGKPVVSAGLGDSPNDFDLLRAVHVPYLVKRPDGKYASKSKLFINVDGVGPEGWNKAVNRFLEE
jgi:mannosyl-3-phosphoglycerate phosphatase